MPQIVFRDTPTHELALEPEDTKAFRPRRIDSRVVLSEPDAVPIDENTLGDDVDLKRFFAGQKSQWSFHAVQVRCTFKAGEGEKFERSQVAVHLTAEGSKQPNAYSMSPLKLAQKIQIKESTSIGSDLKFLKSEIGEDITIPENQLYVVAYNEGTATPYWQLKDVPGISIEGVERFSLIVRAPLETKSAGTITVSADMSSKRFGLVTCRAAIPNIPRLTFSL
jgi:hypothetical protein